MRRFLSLALAAAMLAGPASALAEFATPADLLGAVETEGAPQSFSLTMKGHADQTWFTVWASGSAEGNQTEMMKMKLKSKMTVDVVHGDMKLRVKGQITMRDGSLYAKLDSVDGKYSDEFMSFSTLFGQKLWLKVPMEEAMMEMQNGMMGMAASSADERNQMFTMEHAAFKGGHKYTLKMHPEAMGELSQSLREALGARPDGTSDDFFPFEDLADDTADLTVTVDTNSQDKFQDSKFQMDWKAGSSELSMTGTSQRTSAVAVETPKTFWTLDELSKHFQKLSGMPSFEEDMMMPVDDSGSMMEGDYNSTDTDLGASDEWWQPVDVPSDNPDCYDPDIDALKKLTMQRSGECPVTKLYNRSFR
ncbi:MAG TPA: hypothetical protein PKV72_05830 [Candidatus Peribacteria bacterium]|nr:hypothetical protein [Candidatus Peribacteria bacterium]